MNKIAKLASKYLRIFISSIFIFTLTFQSNLRAESPSVINYQGKLADNTGNPLTGTYSMLFEIYAVPSGGATLFADDRRTTNLVPVNNGIFNVLIGTGSTLSGNLRTVLQSQGASTAYLQVTVGATPLLPRQQLVASPYALGVAQSAIANNEVASGAGITVTKLAPGTFPSGLYSFSGSSVTFSGSGIWRSDGSVGIGTTAPGQNLTVVGGARITGLGGASTQMVVADTNGVLSAQTIPGGGNAVSGTGSANRVPYWVNTSSLSFNTNFYWDNTNTRLGIGLTNPTRTLDVVGNAGISGSLVAGSAQVTGLGGGGVSQMVVADTNGLLSVQAIPTGSITGTGSASRVAYWTTATNLSNSSIFTWDSINSRLGIGHSSPTQNLHVVGSALISGLGNGGTQMVVADNTGVLSVQAIPGGGSAVSGLGSANRVPYWISTSSLSFNTNFYWDNTNSRLGIGLSNPSYDLDVVGTARISGLGGGGTQMVVADNNGVLIAQAMPSGTVTGSGSASRVAFWTTTSNLSNNSAFYWDDANTRLGIGISNPTFDLDVSGTARITGTVTISGASTDITTGSGEDLALMPNGAGQVGVGTTNPGYMLEVFGTLGIRSDGTNTGELKVGYTSSAPAGYYATYAP